jgi:hypothetical protein
MDNSLKKNSFSHRLFHVPHTIDMICALACMRCGVLCMRIVI